ncbi:hypothetical protein ACNHYB_10680 [Isoptericola jiangsuensis]|uniref:DUF7927 domain-containing protein n=1 Tax=Isoptericola jiangsuensis TaxID=548579 RepID=UPI003AAC7E2E
MAAATALTLALAGALVTTGLTVASSPTAAAAPGSPRVPQPPLLLFGEDYENAGDGSNVLVTDYVGASSSYTADPEWANRPYCNGFVIDFTSAQQADDCSAANPVVETPLESFDHLQGLTYALGEYAGQASPETNAALSSYTANQTPFGDGLVVGRSDPVLTVPDEGGYLQLSADFATMNCSAGQAILQFVVVQADGTEHPILGADFSPFFSPCSGTTVLDVTTPGGEGIEAVVSTFTSGLVGGLPAGEPLSLVMRNRTGVGTGNDVVIDNVSAVELSPQLDKEFDPAVTPVGTSSTLTFTVTNTSDLGAKPAFSFTDTLPSGLVVASPANAVADPACGLFFWGPQPGASVLTVASGGISQGVEYCTFSVDVTSSTADVYTNGPDDITDLTGLSPPADATVEFTDGTPQAGLTITKAAGVDSAAPGEDVEYTVTVANTGQVAYTAAGPATFGDDLSGVLDDATFVSADADAGTVDTSALPTLTWSGPLGVGEEATVTYSVTVGDPPGGDGVLENVVTGPAESGCADGAGSGCSTSTPVRGLSVVKSASPEALVPGEVVTYSVVVENTGASDYTEDDPAVVSDDMSGLEDDASYNGDAVADVGAVDDSALPSLTWSGALAVGESATITYSVTVGEAGSGDGVAVNRVTGPEESNCLDGTEDGCFVVIPPAGLAITKTADASVVVPGGSVTYVVEVTNTGDVPYTAGSPASFTDDLSGVLDDATYAGDASADVGTMDDSALPTLSWSGALAPGDTATITYSVAVDDPVEGDGVLRNAVTGPTESSCADATADGCTVETRVRSLEIVKEAAPADAAPGDQVGYTVTVENTGAAPYTVVDPAVFADDLSGVLDDATYAGDATADVGDVDDSALPTLSWNGPLAPGEIATVTYSVTVDHAVAGDHLLDDVVVGPPGSTCVDGTEQGCATSTPVRELTILRSATPDEDLVPGQDIVYTVTVTNSGEVAYPVADPARVGDDLSGVLDDATYQGDASADVGDVDDSSPPQLTWSGPLAIGETATLTYTVTVDDPGTGDGTALNVVTGPGESNCPGGTEDGCTVTIPPRAVQIGKSADVDEVTPGGTVVYTVTVENTGDVPYTAAEPVTVTDDSSGVVDDATYGQDATADVGTVDDGAFPTLVWSGALAPGETATITYSVTVDDPLGGDGLLVNSVSGPAEGTCVDDAGCTAETVVTPTPTPGSTPGSTQGSTPGSTQGSTSGSGPLAMTGTDLAVAVVLTVLLLVTGVFMVSVVRRLRR